MLPTALVDGGGKRWVEVGPKRPELESKAGELSRRLDLHPLAARVLVARGFSEPSSAARFLDPPLEDLPDPFSMLGMGKAVERLERALLAGERIACYGDYDVDGVTSTALLSGFLKSAGGDVVAYVPHRLAEGYGLNAGAVATLAAGGVKLLVSLDCGITDVDEVREAAARGVDTVVVDHHTVPVELPAATAILNPHQPGCPYPSKDLAAVGVTFALVMALRRRLREGGRFGAARPEPNLLEALDLVALGTIADVASLTGANRTLVHFGLGVLSRGRRPGVRALKRVSGMAEGSPVTAGQVGFRLAPRINAAGRLDDAGRGVRLLTERDDEAARSLAEELDRENPARQEIERHILSEAEAEAGPRVAAGARGLVLAKEGWHPGVVGIVASRLVERFHRPVLIVGFENGVGKGSGRSIEPFHLHEALSACACHLLRFGGHKHAAGLTIERGRLEAFREAFEGYAASRLSAEDLEPRCRIDAWVEDADLTDRAAKDLARLSPFGAGHPEPVFALRGVSARSGTVGQRKAHLRLAIGARRLDAIGFGMGDRAELCEGPIDAAFTLGFDEWDGGRRLRLKLRDLRRAG